MTREFLYSPEAEAACVGVALQEREWFGVAGIAPEDFHDEQLASIWRVGQQFQAKDEWFDHISIMDELERRSIPVLGGTFAKLIADAMDLDGAPEYARIVKDYADRRRAFAVIQKQNSVLFNSNGTWRADIADLGAQLTPLVIRPESQSERQAVKTSWTVAELLSTTFPDPPWAVPGIVPVGLSFLAGRPKVGKSWLALQIAHAIGTGGMVMNQRVTAGKVLYLALEDGPRRLKERLIKQIAPSYANVQFETSWRRLTDGGLDDLRAVMGGYALVVIDTLSRALGRADQSDLADMTMLVGDLQGLALEHDAAVLVIDHHRKPAGFVGDPVDDIVGSTAKAAVADAALGLFKEQGKAGAVLKVTGRDVEWQELALSWDAVTCCWQLEGTVEEASLKGRKSEVLDVLRNYHPNSITLTELANITSIGKNNLLPILNELVDAGKIDRLQKQGREVPYTLREGA
jgi:hypothetical protein